MGFAEGAGVAIAVVEEDEAGRDALIIVERGTREELVSRCEVNMPVKKYVRAVKT